MPTTTDTTDPPTNHVTTDYLTKFEFTRVLGMRILQLKSQDLSADDPRVVALRELLGGTNPAVIRRQLPDGTHEDRPVCELKLGAHVRRLCQKGLDESLVCE